ncbi:2,4-dihydroxyhept-2-ene-1,7-dioic acid aldolase [Candidatus Filomicrobium marinum]|uniref:2,4-dihydroxyhept-2-ene-1,7-dioic acid aldolase n=1 Tax=Candidatus Filomicrobium marinum TaxID=1608628 RepID=A0A0D6JDG9_9HYPH|nr:MULTISPECIES: aldolase/citrate lyase family protein [Filomicrobium]MCV0368358.1 2,4-dihydroxyhept-2-ene-1,7-dioic acid aldolase [Filomicrobium sp.]CFX11816.1 2,4-dihydroxyhept-2-ene-1,7-dioic acid aldolase [Candidatus Filomicrobium marinum]CPR17338.1 2,4-dihydroxyhept-2-ene-1,7-dioic acid aldolase [Candidatus Filomicrobium marinum]
MRKNNVRAKLQAGDPVINAWCSLPCAYAAEIMAHQGYDSVTIDLQHGAMGFEAAFAMLQAISTTVAVPFARVPSHESGLMMKLLDAGAYGLICPLVNTRADAEAFVAACRYPPIGQRSYGPNRATLYAQAGASAAYAAAADREIVLLAQIETREAIENLPDILSVPGLDGVYVGPGDLSLSFGSPPSMAPKDPEVLAAMARVVTQAKAAGLFTACHTDGVETALCRFEDGFGMCTLPNDVRLLIDGARGQVMALRAQIPAK